MQEHTWEQSDLSGGLNNSADPSKLEPRFFIVMNNLYYDHVKRVIAKRNGYTHWVQTNPASKRGTVLYRFYRVDEPDRLIAGFQTNSTGELYYWDTSSAPGIWTQIVGTNRLDDNGDFFLATMGKALIICNGESSRRPQYFWKDASDRMLPLGVAKPDESGVSATPTTGGNLGAGTYKFLLTYRVAGVNGLIYEGPPGRRNDPDMEAITTVTTNAIEISGLPTDTRPTWQETDIRIYRTRVNGEVYYLDHEVNWDAVSTTQLTKSDDDLGATLDTWDHYAAPQCKYPAVFKDRLFMGRGEQTAYIRDKGVSETFGNNSRLWFSKVGNPAAWPLENYIDFTPDDGDEINGVVSFAGKVFVFKERRHFTLTYSANPLNGYIEEFSPGLLADRSPAVCDVRPQLPQGALLWIARDKRVYLHNGSRATPVSDPIQTDLNAISLTYLASAVGIWYPDRSWYLLSVDGGNSNGRNDTTYALDLTTGAWYKFDFGFSCATYFGGAGDNNELIAGSLNDTTSFPIYQLDTGTTDNGAAISATLSSPPLSFGDPVLTKDIRKAFLEGKIQNGQDVTVEIFGNRETSTTELKTLTGDGTEGQQGIFSIDKPPKEYYRMKITADDPNIFELSRYGLVFHVRRGALTRKPASGGIGPGEVEAS
jgi:hypothetical protein